MVGSPSIAAQGKRDGFLRPILGRGCDYCGGPLKGAGRGSPQRFCQQSCRLEFLAEARRLGDQTLRRRRATSGEVLDLGAMSAQDRRIIFTEAAMGPLWALAADPEAERARLEGLAPERMELMVPLGEYAVIRRVGLDRIDRAAV